MTVTVPGPALPVVDAEPGYRSPYSVRFSTPEVERMAGLDGAPWNDPQMQACIPFDRWYTPETAAQWGPWGPRAYRYPAPAGRFRGRVARERVVAVAAALIGLDYQHHHVPSWSPPADWPHHPVRSGRRGPGLDCSNFIGFVHSYALGITLPTQVVTQSEMHRSTTEGSCFTHPIQVLPATDHDAFVASLQPADIVYIRSEAGVVSHAVLWLGDCGVGPGTTPLVLDSGSSGLLDAERSSIPAGVRIRPYRPVGWYARRTSHAHRVVPD
ncbi:hypothetical protein JL107_09400 [Nakamurella flavida]|uniref:NlpC/P60 family protein n=1 Tax=Nakamurella flavida TaxID=363630 RepID=A0A939C5Y2_9ACTN|nr:hypothetical protein [Nakamurella flavida]MBM9476657.1 hypothetical protein [Nakamurella flavida]MDP9778905.1 cell wall-associated NlpC family hydrolase [Nakamurella flavida]